MKLGLIIPVLPLLALMSVGCWTDDNEARKALDDQGFTDITITDRGAAFAHFNGCGEDDGNYYNATATNPKGKRVNMLVCCGGATSFKGCVVRSK